MKMKFTFLMLVFFLLSVSVFGQARVGIAIYNLGSGNSEVEKTVQNYLEQFTGETEGYVVCDRNVSTAVKELAVQSSGWVDERRTPAMRGVEYALEYTVSNKSKKKWKRDYPVEICLKRKYLKDNTIIKSKTLMVYSENELEKRCKELVERVFDASSSARAGKTNPFALISREAEGRYDWGVSVGYVSKKIKYEDKDGYTNDYGLLKDKSMSGVQVGIHYDGFLFPNHFGLGIGTGAYYEYYWQKGDTQSDAEYGDYRASYSEHNVYVPLDLVFRVYLSKRKMQINLTFYGGIGGNYGFRNKCVWKSVPGDQEIQKETNLYDYDEWGIKHFYMNIEYGASLRIGRTSINAKFFSPLTDWSGDKFYSQKPMKDMNMGISYMF